LPQAWIASLQYTKVKPAVILNAMVGEFIQPEHTRETDDEMLLKQGEMMARRFKSSGLD
jgi:hypothetical protein